MSTYKMNYYKLFRFMQFIFYYHAMKFHMMANNYINDIKDVYRLCFEHDENNDIHASKIQTKISDYFELKNNKED